ncbi:MAG: HAMP domain-containing histidine kinase [Candidatus Altiarchaeota archaeon]|nr:HAMP domain-containing histidine kinase [Candidatus Altiarchaeota archaeon]
MFFKLFNWLVKRVPYVLAVLLPVDIWSVLMGVPGFVLIWVLEIDLMGNTTTGGQFIFVWFFFLFLAFVGAALEMGILRLFGIKFERKHIRPLNENIIDNHIRPNISTPELQQVYFALNKFDRWVIKTHIRYVSAVVFCDAFVMGLITGDWDLALFIFEVAFLSGPLALICGIPLWELFVAPVRKECKMLLRQRGVDFEEKPFMSLRIKSKFFTILVGFSLLAFLILLRSWDPFFIVFTIIILLILAFLSDLIFKSIYSAFLEIEESAKNLAEGKSVSFFSGSFDKEILDLSQSLDETAGEIRDYQKSLEEKIKELEEYMSVASHDLQQPLAAIQAYTQLLKSVEMNETGKRNVGVIESQADFMRDLLNDLLEYSRAKKTMEYEKVKLREVLEEVREHLKVQIQEKNAEITLKDIPETITGQPKRISQLFLNLISNAIKYTEGKPVVEAGCVEREEEYEFWVKDNGIGIEEKYFNKIFKPFWKLGKEPGTGMGLAICKAVVENHGGRIWIESEPGKGSTFKFTIEKRS